MGLHYGSECFWDAFVRENYNIQSCQEPPQVLNTTLVVVNFFAQKQNLLLEHYEFKFPTHATAHKDL